ncbi:echinoidin-like, partial [Macrobrachium nipponense]|uniref:echinoidin-like n=1 Tax=Macrobrachium nipponense TaxID=159736 RepID=UPI0030C8962B
TTTTPTNTTHYYHQPQPNYTTTTSTTTTTTTTTPAPVYVCPKGWTRFADSCYLISTVKGNWDSGNKYCKSISGSYVTISSLSEQTFVKSQLTDSTWIGYNDLAKEGTFVWASGETSTFKAFNSGEPNNGYITAENCVEMRKSASYLWNDEGCSTSNYYACETALVKA